MVFIKARWETAEMSVREQHAARVVEEAVAERPSEALVRVRRLVGQVLRLGPDDAVPFARLDEQDGGGGVIIEAAQGARPLATEECPVAARQDNVSPLAGTVVLRAAVDPGHL